MPLNADQISLPLSLRAIRRFDFPHKLGVCERLFANRLSKNGICWVETAAGPIWKLDLTNSTHRWIVYGEYEGSALFNWLKRHVSKGSVIVDSGANIGQMTLYFGSYFPRARILAFEPGNYQADWLCECLARNPKISVKLFREALGESEQTMYLQLTGYATSHGGQNVVTAEGVGQPIKVVMLDQVLVDENVSHVDLWKLDVEGFEIPALKGASEWLSSKKIHALWIETMGENGESIGNFMHDMGYASFALNWNGDMISIGHYRDDNTLFLPT